MVGRGRSVALWNSCNECSAAGLYTSFVMRIVAAEDASRPVRRMENEAGGARGCTRTPWASFIEARVEYSECFTTLLDPPASE